MYWPPDGGRIALLSAPQKAADKHRMESVLSPDRLLAIIDVQNEIASAGLDSSAVMMLVVRRAQEFTAAAGAVIERAEGDDLVYHVGSGAGEAYIGMRTKAAAGLAGRCLIEERVIYCPDARADRRLDARTAHKVGAISMLCVPLLFRRRPVGVLKVFAPEVDAFGGEDAHTLSLLSGVIAAHMAHADDFQRHRHESRHDPLTGLGNRRAYEERVGSEVARVRRHGGELAICLLDIDGFRVVNDTLGHTVGDEVLRAVGRHLADVRGEDAAFRLGGDEFGIILVGADSDGATTVARRLELAVLTDHGCGGVAISCGVSELAGGDPAALIEQADAALDRVKRSRQG